MSLVVVCLMYARSFLTVQPVLGRLAGIMMVLMLRSDPTPRMSVKSAFGGVGGCGVSESDAAVVVASIA